MKLPRRFVFSVLLAMSLGAVFVSAQTPPPAPPPPPETRQFDFWIGDWSVTTPDGKAAGTSRIERIADGRGLLENWTGDPAAGGGNGKSLNTWNAAKHQWQQFWVGSGGGVLELAGELSGAAMVLSGEHTVRGRHLIERITWTPRADGAVRQFWEQSADEGKTWQAVFDGLYTRKK